MNLQLNHGNNYKYKNVKCLYRGVGGIKIKDYKINSIHFWPNLTSASKNKSIAKQFAIRSNNPSKFLFEIYVNQNNNPPTNVELPQDWS